MVELTDDDQAKHITEATQNGLVYLARIKGKKCSLNHVNDKVKKDCVVVAGAEYDGKKFGKLDEATLRSVFFLPFLRDHATYMVPVIVDGNEPTAFTTSMLTGCDVWMGWCANDQVFAIHISASIKDPVANLQFKENLALTTIGIINQNIDGCVAYHRFSFDYTSDTDKKPVINGVKKYWKQFKKTHVATVAHFYTEPQLFYMVYQRKQWNVRIRDPFTKTFIFNQIAL